MAFLADGRILVTADYGGRIRLWWLPTTEHLGDLVCGEDEYRPVLGRSSDGRRLACATESAVTIWVIDDREGTTRGAP